MSTADADRRAVTNGRVVTPEGVIEGGHVAVEGDRIVAVGEGTPGPTVATTDVDGRLVLPGLVDLHGDELEHHLSPRRGTRVATETALVSADRANVTAGITTKFHAVAFEEAAEEGRSVETAEEVVDGIAEADGLIADTRVHARCEVGEARSVDAVADQLGRDRLDLVSLMNHLPDRGQFDGSEGFASRYPDGGRVVEGRDPVSPSGLSAAERRLVRAARAAGVPVAAHDVEDERRVTAHARVGVDICEYPVTLRAARAAHRSGLTTAMGAPNLVRGGSLWGNLSARAAVEAGVVDVLCTDFHPPSLLESVLVDVGEPLHRRVRRVSAAPASAVGLTDRGRLVPGARADLLVVDTDGPPRVVRAVVGGDPVLHLTG